MSSDKGIASPDGDEIVPIAQRCPSEILLAIFATLKTISKRRTRTRSLLALPLVCRAWLEVRLRSSRSSRRQPAQKVIYSSPGLFTPATDEIDAVGLLSTLQSSPHLACFEIGRAHV